LFEQRRKHMLYINLLMPVTNSFGLGRDDCFLSLLSESIDVHLSSSSIVVLQTGRLKPQINTDEGSER